MPVKGRREAAPRTDVRRDSNPNRRRCLDDPTRPAVEAGKQHRVPATAAGRTGLEDRKPDRQNPASNRLLGRQQDLTGDGLRSLRLRHAATREVAQHPLEERVEGGPDLLRRAEDVERLRKQRLGLDPTAPNRSPSADAHRIALLLPSQMLVIGPSEFGIGQLAVSLEDLPKALRILDPGSVRVVVLDEVAERGANSGRALAARYAEHGIVIPCRHGAIPTREGVLPAPVASSRRIKPPVRPARPARACSEGARLGSRAACPPHRVWVGSGGEESSQERIRWTHLRGPTRRQRRQARRSAGTRSMRGLPRRTGRSGCTSTTRRPGYEAGCWRRAASIPSWPRPCSPARPAPAWCPAPTACW